LDFPNIKYRFIKDNTQTEIVGKTVELPNIFPLLQLPNPIFNNNPINTFAMGLSKLIVGRNIDNTFRIYDLNTFTKIQTILFHQVFSLIIQ